MSFIRTQITTLDKLPLKTIASSIVDELMRRPFHFKYLQWYQSPLDSNDIKIISTSDSFVS